MKSYDYIPITKNVRDNIVCDIYGDFINYIDQESANISTNSRLTKLNLKINFEAVKQERLYKYDFVFNHLNICLFEAAIINLNLVSINYYSFDFKNTNEDETTTTYLDYIYNIEQIEKNKINNLEKLIIDVKFSVSEGYKQRYVLIYSKYGHLMEKLTQSMLDKLNTYKLNLYKYIKGSDAYTKVICTKYIESITCNFDLFALHNLIYDFEKIVPKLKLLLAYEILNNKYDDNAEYKNFVKNFTEEQRAIFIELCNKTEKNEFLWHHPELYCFFTILNNNQYVNSCIIVLQNIITESKTELQNICCNFYCENKMIILKNNNGIPANIDTLVEKLIEKCETQIKNNQ
ncbi:hypothetical protein BDAP_002887 [Binucleata daphniae]